MVVWSPWSSIDIGEREIESRGIGGIPCAFA